MLEFAVKFQDEQTGRWVLAVDAATNQLLIANEDNSLRWVPMNECSILRVANPDVPRPVIAVQPQPAPKLTLPAFNGRVRGS